MYGHGYTKWYTAEFRRAMRQAHAIRKRKDKRRAVRTLCKHLKALVR